MYNPLSSLTEEENTYKKRRTSSYHDPLVNTPISTHMPSLLPRGERYQSAIALASSHSSLSKISEGSNDFILTVREKAEILSVSCEPPVPDTKRGKIIAIEGLDKDLIRKVSSLLNDKIGSCVLKEPLKQSNDLIPSIFTDLIAANLFRVASLHQTVADIATKQPGQHVIFGGYLMQMADLMADSGTPAKDYEPAPKQEPVESANDTTNDSSTTPAADDGKRTKTYSEQWHSSVPLLTGLPGPDYVVYLQPAEDLAQGEVSVAELKGGSKLLIIGGQPDMEENITESIVKALNLGPESAPV